MSRGLSAARAVDAGTARLSDRPAARALDRTSYLRETSSIREKRFGRHGHPSQRPEQTMPFDPDQHYRNCQDAVAHMSAIAREPGEVLVRSTPLWDALRKSLSEIGIGAAAAFGAIRDAGAEGDYNDAYLSMLRLASNLLGLESLALAHDRI